MADDRKPVSADDLQKAAADVQECRTRLDDAKDRVNLASRDETIARNAMNQAQIEFDRLSDRFHKENAKGTDWDRKSPKAMSVECVDR